MGTRPNKAELKNCLRSMAKAMQFKALPDDRANRLIDHVLFDKDYDGLGGKKGWECFVHQLLTEREIRNLVMAHAATKIARYNNRAEPSCTEYSTMALCQQCELALLGGIVKPLPTDVLDPWEQDNT